MQKTTLSSYPNLVPITPINGVVYKAKTVNRPHPKIVVMPIKEVITHQKQESVATFMPEESRKDSFFRSKKKKRTQKSKKEARASNTMAPEHTEEVLDLASALKILDDSIEFEEKKASPFRRLKSALKKTFRCIIPATPSHNDLCNAIFSEQLPLDAGFHCSHNGCVSCSPPRAPTILSQSSAPRFEPFMRAASFSSGFTYTSSSNLSSASFSLATSDLDVFHDFNGVHIEATPPQLGPVRPTSSFMAKLQGTMIDNWTDVGSSDSEDYEWDVDDTFLTTPDLEGPYTPEVHSTLGSGERGAGEV